MTRDEIRIRARTVLAALAEGETLSTAVLANRILNLADDAEPRHGALVTERQAVLTTLLALGASAVMADTVTRGTPRRRLLYGRAVTQRPMIWHPCEPVKFCPTCGQEIRPADTTKYLPQPD